MGISMHKLFWRRKSQLTNNLGFKKKMKCYQIHRNSSHPFKPLAKWPKLTTNQPTNPPNQPNQPNPTHPHRKNSVYTSASGSE